MPHVSSTGGDDLASTDEVKVYKDEGEEENPSAENLAEDKVVLVTETEEGKGPDSDSGEYSRNEKDGPGKPSDVTTDRPIWNPLLSPYPYHSNGATLTSSLPPPGFPSSLYTFNERAFGSPPPAHMGIPSVHIDPKTGLPRPMYTIPPPPGQFPFYPDLSAVQWSGPGGYPITTGLRGPYPPLSSSPLSRFSPPGLLPPGISHPGLPPGFPPPGLMHPGPKQDLPDSHRFALQNHRDESSSRFHKTPGKGDDGRRNKKDYVKKPLNAFMLFMKEMRQRVIDDCTLKESAAINQILGKKWHGLDRGEQAKYYDMARKEKELHLQLYPGWSARDNYGTHTKKKKRKRGEMDMNSNDSDCANPKKCRARFGLDQQHQWCKPCRRKKKCIRFMEEGGCYSDDDCDDDDEPQGSVASGATGDGNSEGCSSPQPPLSSSSSTTHTTDENRNHSHTTDSNSKYCPTGVISSSNSATFSKYNQPVPPYHQQYNRHSMSASSHLIPPYPSTSSLFQMGHIPGGHTNSSTVSGPGAITTKGLLPPAPPLSLSSLPLLSASSSQHSRDHHQGRTSAHAVSATS